MRRAWRYTCQGLLALDGDRVALPQARSAEVQGIVAFVEHGATGRKRLQTAEGAIRYVMEGRLSAVLARPHRMAREALREGAEIGVYVHEWDDPMAAAFTAKEIIDREGPPWNRGIRR